MSALSHWLVTGVVQGTGLFVVAWLLSVTVLAGAHPSTRATLFLMVLVKFVVPFGPALELSAPTALAPALTGRLTIVASDAVAAPGGWLLGAWVVGVLVLGLVRGVRHVRHLRALRARPVAGELQTFVDQLAPRAGVTVAPRTLHGEDGPALVGVFRPVLVVPKGARGEALEAMVMHELTHLRRRDPLVRLFQSVVETLFFFWPVVRLASRQLDLAREQACDRAVLEKTGISQVNYAELLLSFGLSKRPRLAMAPQPSHLERRIHMVLNHPPSHRLARRRLVLAAFAVLGVVGSGLSFATPPTTTPGIAPKVDGALDPRVVQTLIATQAHDVEACYQAYVKEHAPTDGVLVLHWEVKDDGSVEETCQSSGTTVPMELGRCVSKRVATWTFPSPGYGQRAAIEYTFEFTSKRR